MNQPSRPNKPETTQKQPRREALKNAAVTVVFFTAVFAAVAIPQLIAHALGAPVAI